MRIIGGKYRGRVLSVFKGRDVRPTSDRAREALFNILAPEIYGANVLDLFCGSGSIGLEAISRGADYVVFNDVSQDSLDILRKNLALLRMDAKIYNLDYKALLERLDVTFDIIYVDPPYKSGLGELAVDAAFDLGRVAEGGTVVYEHSSELPFKCAREDVKVRTKVMGSVTVEFIRKKTTGLVTGTFDPVTKGHMEVIEEALRLFDEVVVAVLVNPEKQCMFTPEERLALLNAALSGNTRVKTLYSEDYAVDVARRVGADKLVRGVRGEGDEAYENAMAEYNRAHGFDTVFVTPERYADVSSTRARELISKGDFRLLPENAIITAEEIIRRKGKP